MPTQTKAGTRGRAAGRDGRARGARAALDVLLTDASLSPRQRFLPAASTVKLGAALARRPGRVVSRAGRLAGALGRVAAGAATIEPARGDRRFADPACVRAGSFAGCSRATSSHARRDGVIDDADLDLQDERRVRFALDNVLDALAPANYPWSNPAALKAAIDTGGASFARGARNLVRDLSTPPRLPASVDRSKFTIGKDLAVTPGAVVLRTEVFELIQYAPQTDDVRPVPLLLVPPMINKYYIVDLAPGRSLAEYYLQRGQQVLEISWRNPDERHAHWGLDTYADAIVEALDATAEITKSESTHVAGFCSGGIAAAALAAPLAANGELERIAGLTLPVCVIDNERAGVASALMSREIAEMAMAESARKGYLDGRVLAGVFAWLRPNDLIWSYVANNYLLGQPPPAFDILYWNADTTRMAAGLHRDFIELALDNSLAKPDALRLRGTPIDLANVTTDAYLIAGITDHITPWESCYRTTQLLGGEARFILSTSGHIQALVNPPGNEKATYRTREDGNPPAAEEWFEGAARHAGTWWPDWDAWLAERSGPLRRAPKSLGSTEHKAMGAAPGTYVVAG